MCNTQLLGLTDVLALSKNIDNFSYTREKYKILGVADALIPLYSSDGAMQGNLMTILVVSKSGVYYKVLSATGNTHKKYSIAEDMLLYWGWCICGVY